MTQITLKPGDQLPSFSFTLLPYQSDVCPSKSMASPQKLSTDSWKTLKVVLFSLPGAFTPTCSSKHLPDYIKYYDEIIKKGVDIVAVVSINDPYVMAGWGDTYNVRDKILFLTDTDAAFSRLIGCELDLSSYGLGVRTGRYALIIDRGIVVYAKAEPDAGVVSVSGAEAILAAL